MLVARLSEFYGYSKADILETIYLDEALDLIKFAKKERASHYFKLAEIGLASGAPNEYREAVLHKYKNAMFETLERSEVPEDKLDKAGIAELKVLTGGRHKPGGEK